MIALQCVAAKNEPSCLGSANRHSRSEKQLREEERNALVNNLLDKGFFDYLYGASTTSRTQPTARRSVALPAARRAVNPHSLILDNVQRMGPQIERDVQRAIQDVQTLTDSLLDYKKRLGEVTQEIKNLRDQAKDVNLYEADVNKELRACRKERRLFPNVSYQADDPTYDYSTDCRIWKGK